MKKIKSIYELLEILYDNYDIDGEVNFESLNVDYKDKKLFKYISALRSNGLLKAERSSLSETPRTFDIYKQAKLTIEGIKFVMSQKAILDSLKLTRKTLWIAIITLVITFISVIINVLVC